MQIGINKLADAVGVTLGPRGEHRAPNAILSFFALCCCTGPPLFTFLEKVSTPNQDQDTKPAL